VQEGRKVRVTRAYPRNSKTAVGELKRALTGETCGEGTRKVKGGNQGKRGIAAVAIHSPAGNALFGKGRGM